jgi:hypothetical protein
MHAKVTLVILTTLLLALDIKKKAPIWAFLGLACQLAIMWLIVVKPF